MIARTARIWTRLYKKYVPELKDIASKWLKRLLTQATRESSFGVIDNPEEIPQKFTQILTRMLRESYAQGYWLSHVYVQEVKAAHEGRKYRGRVKLSDISDDMLRELLELFIEGEDYDGWSEIIPQSAIDWLKDYVPKLAGNLNESVLQRVQEVISQSLYDGSTLQERMKALRDSSEELSRMLNSRIESIARTEITRADTLGRLTDMKANDDVIGVEFSAIMDDRTTEICSSRHGLVMRLDDPRLPENTPPCHIRCRSMLLALTVYDYPDGLLTSHEYDEVPAGNQRAEDIAEVSKILNA